MYEQGVVDVFLVKMFKPCMISTECRPELRNMSKVDEVFRTIEALQVELNRLRQVEIDYLKLLGEHEALLAQVEQEKTVTAPRREEVFYFSLGVDRFTGYSAANLEEFFKALTVVPAQSLEFHLSRGDFEAWLRFIGAEKLVSAFGALRNESLYGENLRKRLLEAVQSISSDEGEQ